VNIIARIRFAIKAYFRSHDGSTPEHPRKDGSYGWPEATDIPSGFHVVERRGDRVVVERESRG
jgi:hypothetical protein